MPPEITSTFIANWKLDGSRETAIEWVDKFASPEGRELIKPDYRLIVAPPLELLSFVADKIDAYELPIAVAVQDLNIKFVGVKHTGQAFTPSLVAKLCKLVILGHSEKRIDDSLTDDYVNDQLDAAREHNLEPIVCVSNLEQAEAIFQYDSNFSDIIAYEPIEFVGTTDSAPAKQANEFCGRLRELFPWATLLYGGGVDKTKIKELLLQPFIDGVLIGNRSSGVDFFQNIIRALLP